MTADGWHVGFHLLALSVTLSHILLHYWLDSRGEALPTKYYINVPVGVEIMTTSLHFKTFSSCFNNQVPLLSATLIPLYLQCYS